MNLDSEYSLEVDEMRKRRVEVSYHKYGSARDNFGSGRVDALKTHDLCIDKYLKTKNKEYLLDAMNYLMFEFMYPLLDGVYFKSTGSSESAGTVGAPINMER